VCPAGARRAGRRRHARDGGVLSRASGHVHRAVYARRQHRVLGPALGPAPGAAARQAIRDREPAGRRRSDRRAFRRPRGARRLHHPHGAILGHRDQRGPAQEAPLRSGRRLRAARPRRRDTLRAGGVALAAGAVGHGPHRTGQGEPGPARLCVGRAGHPASSFCRAVQELDGNRADACALSRLGAGADRHRRRPRPAHVLRCSAGARLGQRRQGAGARRLHQGAGPRAVPAFPHCRSGGERIRRGVLADGGGPGGYAEGDRRAAARRDQGRDAAGGRARRKDGRAADRHPLGRQPAHLRSDGDRSLEQSRGTGRHRRLAMPRTARRLFRRRCREDA